MGHRRPTPFSSRTGPKKLLAHLSAWPGIGYPWSRPSMPAWSETGCKLAVAFIAQLKERGIAPGPPIKYEAHLTYPLYIPHSDPFAAVANVTALVDASIVVWTGSPYERVDEEHREEVNAVMDEVRSAQANGLWPTKPEEEGRDEAMTRSIQSATEEMERRVGVNAPPSVWQPILTEILLERFKNGSS
ncbi:hypothetical protein BST61_g1597 [Cercospora zeina]